MIIEWFLKVLSYQILGNYLWQILIFVAIIVSTIMVGMIFNYFIKKFVHAFAAKTETKFDDMIVDSLSPPVIFFIAILGYHIGYNYLTLSESALRFFKGTTEILLIIGIAWLIIRFFDSLIENYLAPFTAKTKSDLDDHLVPIIRKLVKIILVVIVGIMILDKFGYNINSILAGVGLGGLAFALAAKDILANLFGGVSVFTDQPFKIGDRIKIGGYDGYVKNIDIRSTKIKTLEGRIVTIPNAKFADSFIENVTWEPNRKVDFTLGLTYDTPPHKIEKAITMIKEIIKKEKYAIKDNITVFFEDFGNFSLNLKIIYYIDHNNSWEKVYTTKNAINKEILKRFNKEKIEFAFPTQTIELHKKK
ncbi:MAG: mechanosensitive ion channel family protein [Candidatus Woesearchaeota archaeon]